MTGLRSGQQTQTMTRRKRVNAILLSLFIMVSMVAGVVVLGPSVAADSPDTDFGPTDIGVDAPDNESGADSDEAAGDGSGEETDQSEADNQETDGGDESGAGSEGDDQDGSDNTGDDGSTDDTDETGSGDEDTTSGADNDSEGEEESTDESGPDDDEADSEGDNVAEDDSSTSGSDTETADADRETADGGTASEDELTTVVYSFEDDTVLEEASAAAGVEPEEYSFEATDTTVDASSDDDRSRIIEPWRGSDIEQATVRIVSEYDDGEDGGGGCTGTLVGEFHILTAAHCVYDTESSWSPLDSELGWADEVTVHPAVDYSGEEIRHYSGADVRIARTYEEYIEHESVQYDFALLTLDRQLGATKSLEPVDWTVTDPDDVDEIQWVRNRGYPLDPPDEEPYPTMWGMAGDGLGSFDGVEGTLEADIYASGGHSGGPMFRTARFDDGHEILGVLAATEDADGAAPSVGPLITPSKDTDLQTWIQEDRDEAHVAVPTDKPEYVFEDRRYIAERGEWYDIDPTEEVYINGTKLTIEHRIRNVGTDTTDDLSLAVFEMTQSPVCTLETESGSFIGSAPVESPAPFEATNVSAQMTIPEDVETDDGEIDICVFPTTTDAEFDQEFDSYKRSSTETIELADPLLSVNVVQDDGTTVEDVNELLLYRNGVTQRASPEEAVTVDLPYTFRRLDTDEYVLEAYSQNMLVGDRTINNSTLAAGKIINSIIEAPPTATVTVDVYRDDGETPLEDATVDAESHEDVVWASDTTDADGTGTLELQQHLPHNDGEYLDEEFYNITVGYNGESVGKARLDVHGGAQQRTIVTDKEASPGDTPEIPDADRIAVNAAIHDGEISTPHTTIDGALSNVIDGDNSTEWQVSGTPTELTATFELEESADVTKAFIEIGAGAVQEYELFARTDADEEWEHVKTVEQSVFDGTENKRLTEFDTPVTGTQFQLRITEMQNHRCFNPAINAETWCAPPIRDYRLLGTFTGDTDPEFQISGLDPEEATATEGDSAIDIDAAIHNRGTASATQDIQLEVVEANPPPNISPTTPYEATIDEVTLNASVAEPCDPPAPTEQACTVVSFDDVPVGEFEPAEYEVVVSTDDDEFIGQLSVETSDTGAPDFEVTELTPADVSVPEGSDPIDFEATIRNEGTASGTNDIRFEITETNPPPNILPATPYEETISDVSLDSPEADSCDPADSGDEACTTVTFEDVPVGDFGPMEYNLNVFIEEEVAFNGALTVEEREGIEEIPAAWTDRGLSEEQFEVVTDADGEFGREEMRNAFEAYFEPPAQEIDGVAVSRDDMRNIFQFYFDTV